MATNQSDFSPYIGPRPFERGEMSGFSGRTFEISDLLSMVVANRVVILYAASGAGKTSLINAGLIPELEAEGFQVYPVTRVGGAIPDDATISRIDNIYVFNALIYWSSEDADPSSLYDLKLVDYLKEIPPDPQDVDDDGLVDPRVVIFDQFEEIFNYHPERWEDRETFFEQLAEALEADPLLRVILSLREDYIAPLDPYARILPGRMQARYRLERLQEDTALGAVMQPLKGTDYRYAPGVAEQLVQELRKIRIETTEGETMIVTGEYVEPVQLQVVCQSLWRSLPESTRVITEKHLRALGGVTQALSDYYERNLLTVVDASPSLTERKLRDWFENELITPAGTRGTVYRGRSETEGIPNAAVDLMENLYLIRGQYRAGARWYELTHDQFIDPILESNKRFNLQLDNVRSKRQRRIITIVGAVAAVLFIWFWGSIFQIGQTVRELRETQEMEQELRGNTREALVQSGELLLRQGEFAEALLRFDQALSTQADMEDPISDAVIYTDIAYAEVGLENFDSAEDSAQSALDILDQQRDVSAAAQQRARALAALGLVENGRGDTDAALEILDEALGVQDDIDDRVGASQTLIYIARIYEEAGRTEEAATALGQARNNALNMEVTSDAGAILTQVAAVYVMMGDSEAEANILLDTGRVYISGEQYQNAITVLEEALELAENNSYPDVETDANMLLGRAQFSLNDYNEALRNLRRARSLQNFSGDALGAAQTNLLIAQVYTERDDPEQAVDALERAQSNLQIVIQSGQNAETASFILSEMVALHNTLGDETGHARSLTIWGNLRQTQSEYDQAVDLYQEALAIYETANDSLGEMDTLYQLGLAYTNLSQPDSAISSIEEALELARSEGNTPNQINYLNEIASIYASQEMPLLQADALEQAAQVYVDAGQNIDASTTLIEVVMLRESNEDLPGLARALAALGQVQLLTNTDRETAFQNFLRAAAVYVQVEDSRPALNVLDDAFEVAQTLDNSTESQLQVLVQRSQTYIALGDLDAALQDANSALLLNANSPDAFAARGAVLVAQENYVEAAADYRRAIQILPANATIYCADSLQPRLNLQINGRVVTTSDLRVRLVPGTDGRAIDLLENGDQFLVTNGPVCIDQSWWWEVLANSTTGWLSEGLDSDGYFVEPQ